MSSEKTPSLYTTKLPFDEDDGKKRKICSKSLLTVILAAILVGLCIVLTIEFLYPVESRYKVDDIDEVHVYDGKAIDFKVFPHTTQNPLEDKAPWHLDFLINPTRLCETVNPPESDAYLKDPEVKLLMLVPSATSHFAQRRVIRRTWGSVAQDPQGPFRLGFVLGTTTNTTEAELIEKESVAYGDIIQADFEDNYRNLTTKSVLMLKWVSKHCAHAQYFLKADDDTFVNLHVIAQILQKDPYQSENKFISGYIHREVQPLRDPNEKYYVSEEEYPDDKFPPYASGSAYMSTGPTAAQLYEATKKTTPFLSLEDIFVTGLCADDIDATFLHEPSFSFQEPPTPITWDVYRSLATAHRVTPEDIEQIWTEMTKSVFESLGLLDYLNNFSSQDASYSLMDFGSLSELFIFPDRNNGQGLLDSAETELIAQLLNWAGESSSEISSNSKMSGRRTGSSVGGIFGFPPTDVFNLTFFARK